MAETAAKRGSSRHIRAAVGFGISFLFILLSLSHGAGAASACSENGTVFWKGGGQITSARGNMQNLPVRAHSNGGCGQFNDVKAGGTVHISGPCCGNLVEIGWRDYIASCCDPATDHLYRIFVETQVSGSFHVNAYDDPACTEAGTTVTMRLIRGTTTNVWVGHRKCNGGSFLQFGPGLGTNFWSGSPRVETFRFGPPGGGGFILDYHNALQFKNRDNNWTTTFGTMSCAQDNMSDTKGSPNATPATSWQTVNASGSC